MRLKNKLLLLASLFVTLQLQAQQDIQYTQFMFNKLALNPAYAGSSEVACISILHRSQWVGLEGAPKSQVLNFHLPLKNDRVGLGMTVSHDEIGPTSSWSYQLKYSYGVPLANGKLAIGLQTSMRRFEINWNETNAIQAGDLLLKEGSSSRILPNFGAGFYYQNPNFYLGASLPNILRGDLSFYEEAEYGSDFSKETQHFYFMGGLIFQKGKSLKLKPGLLVRYTEAAPIAIDLNGMAIFLDKFWIGINYRMGGNLGASGGESLDAIVQYQITNALRAGVAYDFTLSKMRDYNSGTYEIMLDYCIIKKDQVMTNPRFF